MAHIAHSAQGLTYCRVKALPNQPYMTQYNTFSLIEDLWVSNFLMDVGVSRTNVDARTYLLKQGSCVSSQCPCMGPTYVHPNVSWSRSIGV